MALAKVEELCRALVRLQCVPQHQIDVCLGQLGRQSCQPVDVLRWLEAKGLLTSYQIGRIEKGELEGLVLGHYMLLYRNASGSFARVYRACDLTTGKMVGLKVLRQRWSEDPRVLAEFRREVEIGRTLKHENIVPIYEVGVSGGQHYFSMEFVEGGNLRDFISIRKKLDPKEATKCIREMCSGLAYALSRGVTHRDMKMTNVLMSSQGMAKLVDFGLAGVDDERSGGESAQRALEYATLEKHTGAPRDDPRSDLFFLGAIYYELLTGIPPFPRTRDRQERSHFSRYIQVRPIRSVEPELPRAVARIVDRLMTVNPAQRYQHPAEVLNDLNAAVQELVQNGSEHPGPMNGSVADAGSDSGARSHRPNGSEPVSDSTRPSSAGANNLRTIMCIEERLKQQDVLREYFSKHGYRVLVLSDVQRGLARMQSNPPDCMIIMADALGEAALSAYDDARQMISADGSKGTASVVLVLSEAQAAWKSRVGQTPRARVVVQPITLRELRHAVKALLAADSIAARRLET
jgi:eukaryotic-like serine/threonine-protein kinase